MSTHYYFSLYTKNPEDLERVVDHAVKTSNEHYLNAFGREIQEYEFSITGDCLTWTQINAGIDFNELSGKIALNFPEIGFVMMRFPSDDVWWEEFEWDGKEWKETGFYSEEEEEHTENEKSFLYSRIPSNNQSYKLTDKEFEIILERPDEEDCDLPF